MRELRVSFGDDAGHLMQGLLEHDAFHEVDDTVLMVQPEGDDELRRLLSEAAEGRWIVRVTDEAGDIDMALAKVTAHVLGGYQVSEDGRVRELAPVERFWSRITQVHLY